MKNSILIIVACTATVFNSVAQYKGFDSRNKLTMGLKAGIDYSNVYNTQGEEFVAKSKFGFAGGAFASIPIGKLFGIQPEIIYAQKGFQATGVLLGNTYNVTRTTNYIDIPIFFAFKPSKFITFLAGPQYSYLMKQKDVFANGTTDISQELTFENDNIRKNILCFVGGVDISSNHFVLGARVGWDIQNNNGNGTSSTPRYKNVWYQYTLGYRFYH